MKGVLVSPQSVSVKRSSSGSLTSSEEGSSLSTSEEGSEGSAGSEDSGVVISGVVPPRVEMRPVPLTSASTSEKACAQTKQQPKRAMT